MNERSSLPAGDPVDNAAMRRIDGHRARESERLATDFQHVVESAARAGQIWKESLRDQLIHGSVPVELSEEHRFTCSNAAHVTPAVILIVLRLFGPCLAGSPAGMERVSRTLDPEAVG